MARSKSFFGPRRGSTRDFNFYIKDGEQVTRARVDHVKNPRSVAQMQQRMIMSSAIAAYKGMREICNHSYEGVEFGAPSFQRFMSLNTKMLRDYYNKWLRDQDEHEAYLIPYKQKKMFFGPYIVSEGSLDYDTSNYFSLEGQNDGYINIYWWGNNFNYLDSILSTAQLNQEFGMQVGDTLTFVANGWWSYLDSKFVWLRLTIKQISDVQITGANLSEYFFVDTNTDWEYEYLEDENVLVFYLDFGYGEKSKCQAFTTIISEHRNDKWLRTNCILQTSGAYNEIPSPTDVLLTYPTKNNFILNGK